jgi:hypothetical protein
VTTALKSVRLYKPFAGVTRLTVGEAGVKALSITDFGWLQIAGPGGTVYRPASEVAEGVSEAAEVVTPRPVPEYVPEAHTGPVSASEGLPQGEAGYVAPEPYSPPEPQRIEAHPQRKRGRRG